MLRILLITGLVAGLSVVATPARADHDREIGYLVGGALIGVAIGELAHRSYSNHGDRYVSIHRYHPYSPVRYYAPSRHHRHARDHRYSKGRYYGRRHTVSRSHRH